MLWFDLGEKGEWEVLEEINRATPVCAELSR
jgi:hypothetical protein